MCLNTLNSRPGALASGAPPRPCTHALIDTPSDALRQTGKAHGGQPPRNMGGVILCALDIGRRLFTLRRTRRKTGGGRRSRDREEESAAGVDVSLFRYSRFLLLFVEEARALSPVRSFEGVWRRCVQVGRAVCALIWAAPIWACLCIVAFMYGRIKRPCPLCRALWKNSAVAANAFCEGVPLA